MATPQAQISNLKPRVPTYLPLVDAAQKYGLSEKALTQLIQAGKIEAVQLPTGELLVPADSNGSTPKTKEQIIAEEFTHLRGQPISASEASRKYSQMFSVHIPYQNFSRWAEAGYIEVKERGLPFFAQVMLSSSTIVLYPQSHGAKWLSLMPSLMDMPGWKASRPGGWIISLSYTTC